MKKTNDKPATTAPWLDGLPRYMGEATYPNQELINFALVAACIDTGQLAAAEGEGLLTMERNKEATRAIKAEAAKARMNVGNETFDTAYEEACADTLDNTPPQDQRFSVRATLHHPSTSPKDDYPVTEDVVDTASAPPVPPLDMLDEVLASLPAQPGGWNLADFRHQINHCKGLLERLFEVTDELGNVIRMMDKRGLLHDVDMNLRKSTTLTAALLAMFWAGRRVEREAAERFRERTEKGSQIKRTSKKGAEETQTTFRTGRKFKKDGITAPPRRKWPPKERYEERLGEIHRTCPQLRFAAARRLVAEKLGVKESTARKYLPKRPTDWKSS